MDEAIAEAIGLQRRETLTWPSPLESECFSEYQDAAFLEQLGIRPRRLPLEDSWPKRGPVWEGLARTSCGRYLLIEAKANNQEFHSSPTASSEGSLTKIREALNRTKEFLKVRSETDLSECFYQYANRLAHLHLLRESTKVNALMVFVYFVSDTTVPGSEPITREGWQTEIEFAHRCLGMQADCQWLARNVADVFIDVESLGHIACR